MLGYGSKNTGRGRNRAVYNGRSRTPTLNVTVEQRFVGASVVVSTLTPMPTIGSDKKHDTKLSPVDPKNSPCLRCEKIKKMAYLVTRGRLGQTKEKQSRIARLPTRARSPGKFLVAG